jgi:hypothetical protein
MAVGFLILHIPLEVYESERYNEAGEPETVVLTRTVEEVIVEVIEAGVYRLQEWWSK